MLVSVVYLSVCVCMCVCTFFLSYSGRVTVEDAQRIGACQWRTYIERTAFARKIEKKFGCILNDVNRDDVVFRIRPISSLGILDDNLCDIRDINQPGKYSITCVILRQKYVHEELSRFSQVEKLLVKGTFSGICARKKFASLQLI